MNVTILRLGCGKEEEITVDFFFFLEEVGLCLDGE